MAFEGGCRCGAVRYVAAGEPVHVALCHCGDCRRSAGAPMVGWTAFRHEQVTITGATAQWSADGHSIRRFCAACGTGLFFENETMLPGLLDVQTATLDDPAALPPQVQIQVAERIGWMVGVDALPAFERYPG